MSRPQLQMDVADAALFTGRSIYIGTNGYAYFSTNATGPRTVHAHIIGTIPDGHHIDHINGDKLDNRRVNLRVVTAQVNQANRKRLSAANTSGARGVIHRPGTKNPWIAQITANRRNIYLGSFPTQDAAVLARRSAELDYFGEECPR